MAMFWRTVSSLEFLNLCKSKIRRAYWRLKYFNQKLILVYLVVLVCAFGVTNMANIRIYPLGYHTVIWLLALLFPLTAMVYVAARIGVKQDEILTNFGRSDLWRVYYPREPEPEQAFTKFLWGRVWQYYNLIEFAGYSLLAGAVSLTFSYILSIQFGVPTTPEVPIDLSHLLSRDPNVVTYNLEKWLLDGPTWAIVSASGYLGAYSGAIIYLLQRYRTFDLYPATFLQIAVILISGTFSSAFLALIYPQQWLGALAFIIGFVSALNVNFLARLMRVQCAKLTGTPLPEDIPSDLPTVVRNAEAIDSLNSISVNSIRELAHADPVRLYLNMPQQVSSINLMIDQALLSFYFSGIIGELEKKHIMRFTQLIVSLGIKFHAATVRWPDIKEVSILDNGGPADKEILATTKAIIEGYFHHTTLGLFLCEYRDAFFSVPPDVDKSYQL